jgi:hypothetical protein
LRVHGKSCGVASDAFASKLAPTGNCIPMWDDGATIRPAREEASAGNTKLAGKPQSP